MEFNGELTVAQWDRLPSPRDAVVLTTLDGRVIARERRDVSKPAIGDHYTSRDGATVLLRPDGAVDLVFDMRPGRNRNA